VELTGLYELQKAMWAQRAMWTPEGYMALRGLRYWPQLRSALFGATRLSLRQPNYTSRSEDVKKGR